jgi:hypothetical protein
MLCEIKTVFSGGYLRDKGVHARFAFSSIYGLWLSWVERLVREKFLVDFAENAHSPLASREKADFERGNAARRA